MEMVKAIEIYLTISSIVFILYAMRQIIYTCNRLLGEQRIYYQDIIDSELPYVSVLIPMHNEEKVAEDILEHILLFDYPRSKYEIIPINDNSNDKTKDILDIYANKYPSLVKPLHLYNHKRGKPAALNHALPIAKGEIIVVFDADYIPPKNILRDLVMGFIDPTIGAVMGRVIPINTNKSFLARLMDIERSGGYQIDQQARFNLGLITQYGGTVGGFRKDLVIAMGGFSESILAEDTELTLKMFINGWKVAYANRIECYEEAPESWNTRKLQIIRWARGHTQVLCHYFLPLIKSKYLNMWQKIDGVFFLGYYLISILVFLNIMANLILYFSGVFKSILAFSLILTGFLQFLGNIVLFFEIGIALLIDGAKERIFLLPVLVTKYVFYDAVILKGVLHGLFDYLFEREVDWVKTKRFRENNKKINKKE